MISILITEEQLERIKTNPDLITEEEILNEDFIENALMVAGFVPVIGEVADIILILRYLWKGEYLYAALMLIALIPTVGDFIAKPIIRLLKGAGIAGKTAVKSSEALLKYCETHPEFAAKYVKLGGHLADPLIGKTITGIERIPGIGDKAANKLRQAISEHTSIIGKLQPVKVGKAIGQEVAAGGRLSTGLKTFFRDEKLAQYIAKKGKEPSTWLSNWWNVVMPARRGRRNMVKHFILSNKVLDKLGLPSFEALENKIQHDKEFTEKLANDPLFSQLVNRTTSPEDLQKIEGTTTTSIPSTFSTQSSSDGSNPFGDFLGKIFKVAI
jgi:hypothetical protein